LKVTVKLFASLRGKSGASDRAVEVGEGAAVRDLFQTIGLEITSARAIFVNGQHATPDAALSEGDRIDAFPAIGGG